MNLYALLDMATISLSVEDEHKLMVLTVIGKLSIKEIIEFASVAFLENPQPLILWDISQGSVSNISEDEVRDVALAMKAFRKITNGGKTALVGSSDSDYGVLRMYEVHASAQNKLIKYGAFRSVKQARDWILSK